MSAAILLERLHPRAVLPERMSAGAAGYDVSACLEDGCTMPIAPGARVCVPTGWALAIPSGYEGQVRPRSGLAFRHGVTVLNAPGTIDSDYRGELQVLLVNLGAETFEITPGLRIAQLIIAPVCEVTWKLAPRLQVTERGTGGFGSTGGGSGPAAPSG